MTDIWNGGVPVVGPSATCLEMTYGGQLTLVKVSEVRTVPLAFSCSPFPPRPHRMFAPDRSFCV